MDTSNVSSSNTNKKRKNYSHAKADARKERRRQDAFARQDAHDILSIQERIAKAMSRPGESKRELTRLRSLLGNTPTVKVSVAEPVQVAPVETKPKRTPKSKVVRQNKAQRPAKS